MLKKLDEISKDYRVTMIRGSVPPEIGERYDDFRSSPHDGTSKSESNRINRSAAKSHFLAAPYFLSAKWPKKLSRSN